MAHPILRSFLSIQVIFSGPFLNQLNCHTSVLQQFFFFFISGAYSSCFYTCQNLIEGSLKAWDKWLVNIAETSMCQVSLDPTDVDHSSHPFQRTEWANYRGAEVRRSKQDYTDHQETWWSWSVFKYTRKGLMELEEDKYEKKGLMN